MQKGLGRTHCLVDGCGLGPHQRFDLPHQRSTQGTMQKGSGYVDHWVDHRTGLLSGRFDLPHQRNTII